MMTIRISPTLISLTLILYALQLEPASCKDGTPSKTSFEDARCKCVCPKFKKDDNSTLSDKTVYISPNADPSNCNCPFVVNQPFCSMCECKYENRNTTTIKVVVIIIICVTSLLLVYMLFLLCLDPLIARKPGAYQEHMDEDDQTVSQVPQFESGTRPRMNRQKSVINYVSDEQKRWKSTVQEQRRNIYDKHTMLN
ncbi:proton-transporting V-type ATPase complex assembly regulator TMEM9-like isoform X2 [Mercenaria mercenaria]|uniref:proton-transporting V-type ATPase complex assembly regulator TMEM9-like isoform X2 n=1 Tax=Mercenaria mercenaria TaxID=6596 RepID=UPI00234E42D9|nr:proton-transporting V-type ATPase complex assembly regulator TMEM9-like isoform X2 [Mercenaria mercenaria]